MAINEVFKNPTVKEVHFEILFPNIFSIEAKIGDLQIDIMEKFPKSSLLLRNQFLIANVGSGVQIKESEQTPGVEKIWQFTSDDGSIIVNIKTNSVVITSTKHKTYNNPAGDIRFRDTIEFIVGKFLAHVRILKITRMGLRYVDDCPLPADINNKSFSEYYNSFVNLSNIDDLQKVKHMEVLTVSDENGVNLRFKETFGFDTEDNRKYTLDFDGQKFEINASEYLTVLDNIHTVIVQKYEQIIKEPVLTIMRS